VVYASPDFGPVREVTIADCLLDGGGYTIYGGQSDESAHGRSPGVRIMFNRIATDLFSRGGSDGWLAHFDATSPHNLMIGNTWDGNGRTLSVNGIHWTDRGPAE
jgi:hypothetical protein